MYEEVLPAASIRIGISTATAFAMVTFACARGVDTLLDEPTGSAGFEILEFLWTFNMPTDHAHIRLTDVRVPHSAIFGGEGRGLQVTQHFFN